jgi:hypothetical protein
MSYVKVQYAAEQLGCTVGCLFLDTPKYRPYLRLSRKGKKDAGFNLEAFTKAEATKSMLLERTKLLTEYLNKIESMTYEEIAELSGVGQQSIWSCSYAFNSAYKIAKAVRDKLPYHFERFERYYGW